MARTPVTKNDLVWLLMDRPNNLMYVHSLMWLKETPDWDAVRANLQERVVDRFPVFRRRAVEIDGTWYWEDIEDFDVEGQIRRATLPAPGGRAEASAYVSERMSQPFDHSKPLWEIDYLEGAAGFDGTGEGVLVFSRFHHGLADGIRLVQVMLSQLDPLVEMKMPKAVGRRPGGRRGPLHQATDLAKSTVADGFDFVLGAGKAAFRAPVHLATSSPRTLARKARRYRDPARIVERVSEVASDDNELVNNFRTVGRLTLSGRSVDTVWSGTVGVEKKLTWITGISLKDVRAAGKGRGASVNDVLLSGVSLGVTDYLASKGVTDVDQVSWLIPVAIKPITEDIPEDLGNFFAVVNLPMPLGQHDTKKLLTDMHTRMNRLKNSAEPILVYTAQQAIAETPEAVSVAVTNFIANKSAGQITNVPGPRVPMALAGTEVTAVLGFVPMSGDQPLGICIFSYNGKVSIGLAADAALVPDLELLADCVEKGIERLTGEATRSTVVA